MNPENPPLVDYKFAYCDEDDSYHAVALTAITLRDVFAAVALAGYCGQSKEFAFPLNMSEDEAFAYWSYQQADAMLRERATLHVNAATTTEAR